MDRNGCGVGAWPGVVYDCVCVCVRYVGVCFWRVQVTNVPSAAGHRCGLVASRLGSYVAADSSSVTRRGLTLARIPPPFYLCSLARTSVTHLLYFY